MHIVFFSFYHSDDQYYKNALVHNYGNNGHFGQIFIDWTLHTGEVDDKLNSDVIKSQVRDLYLRESLVTIIIVGENTKKRKHIDWEIAASMSDGDLYKRSGILVIYSPIIEKSENKQWYLPDRLKDNFAKFEELNWSDVNSITLRKAIECAYENRAYFDYDVSRPLKRKDG